MSLIQKQANWIKAMDSMFVVRKRKMNVVVVAFVPTPTNLIIYMFGFPYKNFHIQDYQYTMSNQ
jgi:hypothetical protein